jgi:nucleoside-diphosphate-sugar epimerase
MEEEMSKKVLIIGGAGFIGMNILNQLTKRGGYEITIVDNFFRGKMDNELFNLVEGKNIKIISADFTEASAFSQLDNDYDHVYMLASVVGVEYTQEMPNELIRINTSLILNTLEWIKNSHCKKVLFTSTSECYAGAIESFNYKVPTPEVVPLCITDITHPRFTYAVTKMLGESGFIQYSNIYGFDCTIIRYHNVYGPRMGFKHVIPQVVKRFLMTENPFIVFGFNQTRAFNFVDDAVDGTIAAMENPKANGEIFHIGDMKSEITIEELVHYIGDLVGFKGTFKRENAHSGSVSRRCPDTGKAEKYLGYKAKVQWKEGVEKTVEWYVDYINSGKLIFE